VEAAAGRRWPVNAYVTVVAGAVVGVAKNEAVRLGG